jgi:predicted transcriptional regulator YheO
MPLSAYYPLCNAIALLLQPQAEVVLHDLATEAVAHIANPFSHREVGHPSLLHEIDFRPDVGLIGPYEKVNFDGRRLKSISAVLREDGRVVGVICVNLDVTHLRSAIKLLTALTRLPLETGQPVVLFQED